MIEVGVKSWEGRGRGGAAASLAARSARGDVHRDLEAEAQVFEGGLRPLHGVSPGGWNAAGRRSPRPRCADTSATSQVACRGSRTRAPRAISRVHPCRGGTCASGRARRRVTPARGVPRWDSGGRGAAQGSPVAAAPDLVEVVRRRTRSGLSARSEVPSQKLSSMAGEVTRGGGSRDFAQDDIARAAPARLAADGVLPASWRRRPSRAQRQRSLR